MLEVGDNGDITTLSKSNPHLILPLIRGGLKDIFLFSPLSGGS